MAGYQNYETAHAEDLAQLYRTAAERFGDKTLFLQKNGAEYRSVTYRAFAERVDATVSALCAEGLSGRHTVIVGENCVDFATLFFAVVCGGGVAVPADPSRTGTALAELVAHCDAETVFYAPSCTEKLRSLPPQVKRIGFDRMSDLVAKGKKRLSEGDRSHLRVRTDPDRMCALIGGAGKDLSQKTVMLSQRNLCFSAETLCKMIQIGTADVFLSVLPLQMPFELICGLLAPMMCGAAVAFGEGMRAVSRDAQLVNPTVLLCTPLLAETLYQKLQKNIRELGIEEKLRNAVRTVEAIPAEQMREAAKRGLFPLLHQSFGGKLRHMIVSGVSVLPAARETLRTFGIQILPAYGCAECAGPVALTRDSFSHDSAMGQVMPDTLLEIRDRQEDGSGEIRYRAPNVMLGYYKAPDATARVLRNGWLYTGHTGYVDTDGFLFITGNTKNAVTLANGVRLFPEATERRLLRSPYVKECAVIGFPSDKARDGAVPMAIIRPNRAKLQSLAGKKDATGTCEWELKKLLSEANGSLPLSKRVVGFLITDEPLPKNAARVIDRETLTERHLARYREKIKKESAENR